MSQIYSGSDIQFRAGGLEPRTEYTIRVCGVRIPPVSGQQLELNGPFSPPAIFTTLTNEGANAGSGGAVVTSKRITSSGTGVLTRVRIVFYVPCFARNVVKLLKNMFF